MSTYQRQLGKYELVGQVGSGASGEVWKAFDTEQKRFVALKILRVAQQGPADLISQFLRGAQQVASLQHPNIVQILDLQVSLAPASGNTVAYIVTEYVEGSSLAEHIRRHVDAGSVPTAATIVYLFTAIGDALDYAHRRGIIHHDIKPANILLDKHNTANTPDGEPRLTDFGMNQMQKLLTLPLNDVLYLSPEQAQGFAGNERSDLYSLGVILYEICTGVPPFRGSTPSEIMMQHIHAVPPSPSVINPHVSPALAEVITRSLAKDPAARFPTGSALAAALSGAFNMPVPASTSQPGFASDVMNSPTYLSSPRQNSSPGMTPLPQSLASSAPSYSQPAIPAGAPSMPPMSEPRGRETPTYAASNFATVSASQSYPAISASGYTTPVVSSAPGTSLPGVQPLQGTQMAGGPPPSAPPSKRRRRKWPYIIIATLLIVAVIVAGVALLLQSPRTSPLPAKTVVGHAFFVSSGQLGLFSNRGIADQVQLNLQHLPDPQAGKSYYAWLLGDNDSDSRTPVFLGQLPVSHGQASIFYKGDAQNSNLLISYSRFLVTEEDSNPPPTNPSLDPGTWRYYAAFSQAPSSAAGTGPHYSVLDHLRHLLAQDPSLTKVGLGGGLDIWLFRNMEKLLEWAGSARDTQQSCMGSPNSGCTAFIQRQATRILDYLDGPYVAQENIPASIQGTRLLVDPTIAKVALLEFDTNQTPPGYLKHIGNHLRSLIQVPNLSPEQRTLTIRITAAINNIQGWLDAVRSDAEQVVHMSSNQLVQPAATPILDDLFTKVNFAFVGQTDPNTNQVKEGVVQIHYNIQRLATFTITPCISSNATNPCL